jgi:hypothetical protein
MPSWLSSGAGGSVFCSFVASIKFAFWLPVPPHSSVHTCSSDNSHTTVLRVSSVDCSIGDIYSMTIARYFSRKLQTFL